MLGHVNVQSIQASIKNKTFDHFTINDINWSGISNFQCVDFLQGKSRKHNHTVGSRLKYQKIYQPLEYIHSVVFGPVQVSKPYINSFVTFTDGATRLRWGFPLTDKSADTMRHIVTSLILVIKRQFRATVLCFQCDQGREYDNKLIQHYLKENGIQCIFNSVADSSSNGVAERANLVLLNDCGTLLTSAKLPQHLWFYAIQFSTIIRNSEFPACKSWSTGS